MDVSCAFAGRHCHQVVDALSTRTLPKLAAITTPACLPYCVPDRCCRGMRTPQGPSLPVGKRNSLVTFFNDILPVKISRGEVSQSEQRCLVQVAMAVLVMCMCFVFFIFSSCSRGSPHVLSFCFLRSSLCLPPSVLRPHVSCSVPQAVEPDVVYLLDADSGHPVRATFVETASFELDELSICVPSARTGSLRCGARFNNSSRHNFGRVGISLVIQSRWLGEGDAYSTTTAGNVVCACWRSEMEVDQVRRPLPCAVGVPMLRKVSNILPPRRRLFWC